MSLSKVVEEKMRQERTLQIDETDKSERVTEFLNSKARNSERTKKIYHFALSHFQTFLSTSEYKDYNIESILIPLNEKIINVYSLLNKFVGYLMTREYPINTNAKLSTGSISLYIAGVRSYLEYHDIDISPNKFKRRVTLPKKYYGNGEGIDAEDIRVLLLACTNTRLKVFLLVLASSGMRATEALSLRNCDVNFSQSPTKVHLKPETTKTKQGNDVYISDEATKELKKFIDSKYTKIKYTKFPNELVFSIAKEAVPASIYKTLSHHFIKLLGKTGMNQRKDGEGTQRRQISFHSFRRFVKTAISNQGYQDFSEWILGHRSSLAARYYTVKEQERREIYKKCMKYLTFLDYATVQTVGKDFESKLKERDQEVAGLKDRLESIEEERDYFKEKGTTLEDHVKLMEEHIMSDRERMDELEKMYLKAMAGHVVMESHLDSKGRTKRKIIKTKTK